MTFYKTISHYYDQIFPVKEEVCQFIRNGRKKLKVLDVACGNGGYLNRLSTHGFYGFGIDLDHEMVHIANLASNTEKVDFYQMDMLEIDTFKGRSFDMIYSIGNSIVHLQNEAQMEEFVQKAYQLLKPKGEILLQIINYDRILDQHIPNLPTIVNGTLSMERNYKYVAPYIHFQTILNVDNQSFENEVTLLPLRSDALIKMITRAGFKKIECYGDFQKSPFQKETSMHFILRAYK
ncbi:MAG TPA: methyltransferase domain-containing protein [Bacilli bacterium]|nr:methyltransferase domain-containing protein [Bacilli bacterium]